MKHISHNLPFNAGSNYAVSEFTNVFFNLNLKKLKVY